MILQYTEVLPHLYIQRNCDVVYKAIDYKSKIRGYVFILIVDINYTVRDICD